MLYKEKLCQSSLFNGKWAFSRTLFMMSNSKTRQGTKENSAPLKTILKSAELMRPAVQKLLNGIAHRINPKNTEKLISLARSVRRRVNIKDRDKLAVLQNNKPCINRTGNRMYSSWVL